MRTLRLGTRGSALAMTQSRLVARALEECAARAGEEIRVELRVIHTRGDHDPTSLAALGGVGVFATALRRALLEGEADLAVHSFKDLPTAPAPGLVVAAVPPREDPRDALCAREGWTLAQLPAGARVGTGSPRRGAQLLSLRPDLTIVDLRGNVPTRLARVKGHEALAGSDGTMGASRRGDLDAVVLAYAGLRRLALADYVTDLFSPVPSVTCALQDEDSPALSPMSPQAPLMMPAAAQGALAVEVREDVSERLPVLAQALALFDDPVTHSCVRAERALMARVEAGCAAPLGVIALPHAASRAPGAPLPSGAPTGENTHGQHCATQGEHEASLELHARVVSLDGSQDLSVSAVGPQEQCRDLGANLAQTLLSQGGGAITDLHARKAPRS